MRGCEGGGGGGRVLRVSFQLDSASLISDRSLNLKTLVCGRFLGLSEFSSGSSHSSLPSSLDALGQNTFDSKFAEVIGELSLRITWLSRIVHDSRIIHIAT